MPSNVLVSGLSDTQYNGLYVYDGDVNGFPSYRLNENVKLYRDGEWILKNNSNLNEIASESDVIYPWLANNWYDGGIDPTGVVLTEVPAIVDPIAERDAKYATTTEAGSARFRRLVSLGYV